MCDWTNLNDDEFDWTRNKGGTGTSGTGPGVDHTLGTSEGGSERELWPLRFTLYMFH